MPKGFRIPRGESESDIMVARYSTCYSSPSRGTLLKSVTYVSNPRGTLGRRGAPAADLFRAIDDHPGLLPDCKEFLKAEYALLLRLPAP
jgi:hypothetical protein